MRGTFPVKFALEQVMKAQTGGRPIFYSSLSLSWAIGVGWWLTTRPSRFTPGNEPVPIVNEAGWDPGPVCVGA